jgi:DNA end-binding protein Ku
MVAAKDGYVMANRARSIASLSISFGLVSIPVKLYSATESSAAIRFKLMSSSGTRVWQQYVADGASSAVKAGTPLEVPGELESEREEPILSASRTTGISEPRQTPAPSLYKQEHEHGAEAVIERSTMVKGYEYEKGKYVVFTPEELRALEAGSRKTIEIISFIPDKAVEPIYYDKAYLLVPDTRGAKPYSLLLRAMRDTGRCALAKWAFRSKEYVVQIRAAEDGIVLQQLFYADEVRSFIDLRLGLVEVGDAELKLAKQLIEHSSADSYNPADFIDEEKQRIYAAVAEKVAGKRVVAPREVPAAANHVVSLLDALRASLEAKRGVGNEAGEKAKPLPDTRKSARRAPSPRAPAAKKTRQNASN